MKRARRPERSTERTKERLLDAGKRAFARHGFHGATVQQIADDAGVNVSLISHHFGGKEALYRCCLQGFGEMRIGALERFLAVPKSVEEFKVRLEVLVNELLDQHLADPDLMIILLRDVHDPELWGKDLERELFAFTTKLAHIFAVAKTAGFLRPDADPLVAATVLYMTFAGLIQVDAHIKRVTGTTLRDAASRRSLIDKVLAIIFNGVLAP